jgi:hypothetical protein
MTHDKPTKHYWKRQLAQIKQQLHQHRPSANLPAPSQSYNRYAIQTFTSPIDGSHHLAHVTHNLTVTPALKNTEITVHFKKQPRRNAKYHQAKAYFAKGVR